MNGDTSYIVLHLLNDHHIETLWYSKPHARASFFVNGVEILVRCTFCDRDCYKPSGSIGGF